MRGPLHTMMWIGAALSIAVFTSTFATRPGLAADDVARGQALYRGRCAGCHSVDADRIGPRHRNVVGRTIAAVPTYKYSLALKKLSGVWTPDRLDQWLSDTQKMAPGSKMYLKMDDPEQRRLIIAYLQSVSAPAK